MDKAIEEVKTLDENEPELTDAQKAFVSLFGESKLDEFDDYYEGEFESEADFAEHLLKSCGVFSELKTHNGETHILETYFNVQAYAFNIFVGDYRFYHIDYEHGYDHGYVFSHPKS